MRDPPSFMKNGKGYDSCQLPKRILVPTQEKYEQTSVRGQTSCIINHLKEFHQSLLNSKRDKSLHLEKVGGWRRLCIYIYSQLGIRSSHLGVNLLTTA